MPTPANSAIGHPIPEDAWLPLVQGRLLWCPHAFIEPADLWLAQLQNDIPWQQHRLRMFGKELNEPRLSCWMGERSYRYSGKTRAAEPWHPLVKKIAQQVSKLCGQPFNGVLLNLYRHGQDSMGWHADNEPALGINPTIASLTLGASRRFKLRHTSGEQLELVLSHGSLLVMAGEMQHHWQHALPKMAACHEPRINLTFRWLNE
ncbi:alpha-ketoglutarate-dependent dioxygenase AlkB family protein [Oceanisphaera avium]|uniref:Alpha-ketoglutarate-dependent dioxygenase AlkB n=1 Tax=Oceanisphaera avium TaxID=1903694 RepID=A0A1Y0CWY0_9GAMM|nr:alpha-ketoglutarate-dependent dioxygenase AlkB [Oceanisphaera avium]ART79850.1 alpha-ketoglutarate-dependent dioxygenase AlkB [Oceanisphaera avium]